MMTSQILNSVDFTKTQKPRYLENETIFSSKKKSLITHKGYFMTKNSFVAEVTFKSILLTIPDSLLISRFCRNLVNGYTSEWLESDFELPQGSILSPVLFLVFTGDLSADPAKSNLKLPNCPSKYPPNESKYADDYNLW